MVKVQILSRKLSFILETTNTNQTEISNWRKEEKKSGEGKEQQRVANKGKKEMHQEERSTHKSVERASKFRQLGTEVYGLSCL